MKDEGGMIAGSELGWGHIGLRFWSSVLSSAEQSGARIEGCGLARTRPVSRTPFDRLRMRTPGHSPNLPRLCLATHPYVGYNSIHYKA